MLSYEDIRSLVFSRNSNSRPLEVRQKFCNVYPIHGSAIINRKMTNADRSTNTTLRCCEKRVSIMIVMVIVNNRSGSHPRPESITKERVVIPRAMEDNLSLGDDAHAAIARVDKINAMLYGGRLTS